MTRICAERVVLGDGVAEPLRIVPAAIEIEGTTITSVDEGGSGDLDLGGVIICPAFVNAHTHVALNAARGLAEDEDLRGNMVESLFYRLESEMSPADVRAFARMGAFECLATGTGLVWDHYYGGTELAEAFCDVGLCAVVGPTLQDIKGPGARLWEAQLAATVELESWSARGIWSAIAPHATDTVSEGLWRRVAELAQDSGRVVHAHVAQSIQEYRASVDRHGCSPTGFLKRIGVLDAGRALWVHMVFASSDDLSMLDSERHTLGFCPLSASQFAFPGFVADWEKWFVATDCAASNDSMNIQRELPVVAAMRAFLTTGSEQYRAFRQSGAGAETLDDHRKTTFDQLQRFNDPEFLLSKVWSVPGRLHPMVTAGVIEPGALANLLVLDPHHPSLWPGRGVLRTLALADTQGAIQRMMVRGAWTKRITAKDAEYRDARHEASSRLNALMRRIGA